MAAGAGKRFSAGTIFLQVVPVFAGVQEAIREEVKDASGVLGRDMERQGAETGRKYGKAMGREMASEFGKSGDQIQKDFNRNVEAIGKSLDSINVSRLSSKMKQEVLRMKEDLASIHDVDITARANFDHVLRDLRKLESRLETVKDVDIKGTADFSEAIASVTEFERKLDKSDVALTRFESKVRNSARKAAKALEGQTDPAINRLKARLESLGDVRVTATLSAGAINSEIKALQGQLAALDSKRVDINVRASTRAAIAELAAVSVAADRAGKSGSMLGRIFHSSSNDALSAATAFRSLNYVLVAVVAILPTLGPMAAAAGGGLLALATAGGVAAASLTTLVIGLSGIGPAVQALNKKSTQAGKIQQDFGKKVRSSAKAVRDAKRSLADAERNAAQAAQDAAKRVADAREDAADAIEDALERQREAQERYRDSVREVQEAERDLAEARAAAADTGKDLNQQIRENQLAIDQALIDAFNARVELQSVNADGSSTNLDREQARINDAEAQLAVEKLRDEQADLAAAKKKWDKEGVNGTEQVKTAQESLTDAIKAQKDAQKDAFDAAEGVDEARADGAERVSEALQDQARSAQDSARAIADAQQGISDALASQSESLGEVSSQQQAVNEAFDALGPAGQRFALYIASLTAGFYRFRDAVQAAMLPAIQEALSGFLSSENASTLARSLIGLAAGFGEFTKALSVSFQGDAWGGFFRMLGTLGPEIQKAYGNAFIKFLEALASILTVSAPFALLFARGIERIATAFADWASSKKGREDIQDFLDYVQRVGPKVVRFFRAIGGAVFNVMKALAPVGEVVIGIVTAFAEWIAQMDSATLQKVLTVVMAAFFGISAVLSSIALAAVATAVATAPLWAIFVGVFVALSVALAGFARENEAFRKWIKKAWAEISAAFMKAWEKDIKPALTELQAAFMVLWKEVLLPFFKWLGPIILWAATKIIPVLGKVFGAVIRGIAWYIKNILVPWLTTMGKVFSWTWKNVIKPVFQAIKLVWEITVKALRAAWNKWGQPLFDGMKKRLSPLAEAFRWVVARVSDYWSGLRKVLASPIIVGFKILNALIDGMNSLGRKVGAKTQISNITPPKWLTGESSKKNTLTAQGAKNANRFRSGGIMPGYTPGRDVHDFYSPTGGRLHLSGGEAIMRPEFTAAIGPSNIHRLNAIARKKGVNGLKQVLEGGQAYAKGGVFWPLPGGSASTYPGHDGVDLNAPNDNGKPYYAAVPGNIVYVGSGRGYGNAIFQQSKYGTLVYGHSSRTAVKVGQTVAAGQYIGNVGSTGNSSGPHLHFGFPGGSYGAAMALLSGAAKAGYGQASGFSVPNAVKDFLKGPADVVKGWISKPLEELGDSPFHKIISEVPKKLIPGVISKMKDIIPDWVSDVASMTPLGMLSGAISKIVGGSVQDQVRKAVGEGHPSWAKGAQWNALSTLISKESSWNPKADNPTSTAYGLFQFLDSTRAAYGLSKNASPAEQAAAGARYIADRYGSPIAALAFHNRNNWYDEGGIYGENDGPAYDGTGLANNGTMMYDSGGYLPPGLTTVVNLTGKPEPVFTADQFAKMGGGTGAGVHYEPHFEGSDLTAEDVAGDLNFQFHKFNRGGKYAGVGGPGS